MIIEILGLPGAGKTTCLTWICLRALAGKPLKVGHFSYKRYIGEVQKYKRVFSNVPIDGTYKLEFNDLGKYEFDNSLIVIDEAGSLCDSRAWRDFDDALRDFINLHRHYHVDIVICSQSLDIDKKIRDRVALVFKIERFGAFTKIIPIKKDLDIRRQFAEDYQAAPPIATTFLWRWLYYSAFDSYDAPSLPPNPAPLWSEVVTVHKYVPRYKQVAETCKRKAQACACAARRQIAAWRKKRHDRRRNTDFESMDS